MKKLLCSIALYSVICPLSMALSPEAKAVLDKKNRTLPAPPKSLKANSADPDYRYAQAIERSEASEAQLEEAPVTSVYAQPQSKAALRDERGLSQFLGERNLGVGFVGGGAYGIFGAEIDLRVEDQWTAGLGIGTGMTYRTWGIHARYLFRQSHLTGFVEGGYSNWHVSKVSQTGGELYPRYMSDRFLKNKFGALPEGQRAHLIYPGFGMLYKHSSGMGAIAQVQYFINTSGGLQGALGASAGLYMFF